MFAANHRWQRHASQPAQGRASRKPGASAASHQQSGLSGFSTFGLASESRRIRYSSTAPSAVPSAFGTITNQSFTHAPYLEVCMRHLVAGAGRRRTFRAEAKCSCMRPGRLAKQVEQRQRITARWGAKGRRCARVREGVQKPEECREHGPPGLAPRDAAITAVRVSRIQYGAA